MRKVMESLAADDAEMEDEAPKAEKSSSKEKDKKKKRKADDMEVRSFKHVTGVWASSSKIFLT